jgi:cytochrome c oxidase subunit 2
MTCAGTLPRLFLGVCLGIAAPLVRADYGFAFQKPVTPVAEKILDLHNLILLVCLAIFAIVFCFMFYAVVAHRKSRGYKAAKFHDNLTLEVVWSAIPFLILVGMAIPSTATLLEMDDTSRSEITVKITGFQWKWRYDYPDHDVSFFSSLATPREQIENKAKKGRHYLLEVDHPLVLPVGKKVRFLVTANDVIHSWWVPALGVKKDAIPGFINETWARIDEPGTYRGQCAELCGKDHGFMPIVVQAVSPEEFEKWVSIQKDKAGAAVAAAAGTYTKDELMGQGKKVYAGACAACHGAKGEGAGTFPKMAGSKIVKGPLADHLKIVLRGKPGSAMPAFAAQLNDAELAAVVTYERNAFGNNEGSAVQPAQVKAARQ